MFKSIAFGENQPEVGIQYGGRSKLDAKQKEHCVNDENQPPVPLSREQEIEQITKSEYRRQRLGDKEVYLLSPDRLNKMGEKGAQALSYDAQYELKIDVASALRKFSPTERRIIFRVYVQGQSVDLATKGSKKSSSYWHYWLQHTALPHLRKYLSDYQESQSNEPVVVVQSSKDGLAGGRKLALRPEERW